MPVMSTRCELEEWDCVQPAKAQPSILGEMMHCGASPFASSAHSCGTVSSMPAAAVSARIKPTCRGTHDSQKCNLTLSAVGRRRPKTRSKSIVAIEYQPGWMGMAVFQGACG